MTAHELLASLRSCGVALSAAAGRLRVEAPPGIITPTLRAALSAHKRELLALLTESERCSLADCLAVIRETFEAVADYVDGALALVDTNPDLSRRFRETEAAIEATVKAGPTERELRTALAAHVAVIHEACQRRRAQCEAAADRMPELPEDAAAAVGVRWADGNRSWVAVARR